MRDESDDRPQSQPTKPLKTPPSRESPSRKRILADPKPKLGSAAASSDSALSSVSSSDRFRKKTRDLPNLSDCHSCGVHINNTNPKDKLQTLDSFWRIVLLCRKCIKRVGSSELCSYCFSEADADCYTCRDCERRIHRDCVSRYRCFAPWSYCYSELGFSVCVDCWIPKLLANSNRVCKRRRNKENLLKPCCDSKVSGDGGSAKSMEDVVSDAKSAAEKKIADAAKAKENALRKAVVARRAVELANGALELVAKNDDNGENNEYSVTSCSSGSDTTDTRVVDDAELAFRLHRAMNSSPRISRNFCLVNSSCFPPDQRIRDCNGNLSVRSSGSMGSPNSSGSGKIALCTNSKLNENTDSTVSEPSVYVRPSECGSRISLGNLKQEGLVYMRRCKKGNEFRGKGGGIVGNCNPGADNSLIFEVQNCQKQDELAYDLHPDGTRNQSQLMCDGNRYMLKYSKKPFELKLRHMLNYLKEISNSDTKTLYDGSYVESKAKAVALPPNYSEDCRTFSELGNEFGEKGGGIVGNCNPGDDNSLIFEAQNCQKQDELEYDLHPNGTKNQSQLMCDGNRYMLKYSKKKPRVGLELRCMLNYSKMPVGLKAISNSETKILYDGSYVESKAKAVALPPNYSEDCRTFSDASFESHTVSLQASACASGSS